MSYQLAHFRFASQALTVAATSLLALACSSSGASSTSGSGATQNTGVDPAAGASADATAGMQAQTPPPTPASDVTTPLPVAGNPDDVILAVDEEPMLTPVELTEDNACGNVELVPDKIEVQVPKDITTTMEVLQPVAFYIVLDNSGSMDDPLPGFEDPNNGQQGGMNMTPPTTMDPAPAPDPALDPMMQQVTGADAGAAGAPSVPAVTPTHSTADATTRWELAVASLQEFVTSPESAGVDVAIQYFNPPDQGRGGGVPAVDDDVCTGVFHSTPDVSMGRLPDNAQALVDSLDAASPNGTTPTVGALAGGVQYCEDFQAQNPDEHCVVVLVTDGLPHGCGLCQMDQAMGCFDPASLDTLAPLAAAGLAAGVQTFTVAMDGVPAEGFTLLDAIAAAGGTDCTPPDPGNESCNVSSTGSAGLVETLTAIRESVTVTETVTEVETVTETETLECQWGIPAPPEDQGALNPDRVNVTLALDGGDPEIITSVESEADCATTGGVGWYYDNPEAPTMIFACPESCATIQNAEDPSIQILLGCARQVPDGTR